MTVQASPRFKPFVANNIFLNATATLGVNMNKIYFSLALILASAIVNLGQTGVSARSTGQSSSTIEPGQVFSAGAATAVQAQLQKSIDVKNAQVGDEVVLRTTRSIKENGETIIPKGTSLIGRVTEVQKRTK